MNGTSEPDVHLSTDAVNVSFWLHTLLDNRNQKNKDSITLTPADGGKGVSGLSAYHPCVIDNLAAWGQWWQNSLKARMGSRIRTWEEMSMCSVWQNPSSKMILQRTHREETLWQTCVSPTWKIEDWSPWRNLQHGSLFRGGCSEYMNNFQVNFLVETQNHLRGRTLSLGHQKTPRFKQGTLRETDFWQLQHFISVSWYCKETRKHGEKTFSRKCIHPKSVLWTSAVSQETAHLSSLVLPTAVGGVFVPEGADPSAASHPTARTRLTEAHRTITSFSLSTPDASWASLSERKSRLFDLCVEPNASETQI